MMKKLFSVAACGLTAGAFTAQAESASIDEALKNGEFKAKTGVYYGFEKEDEVAIGAKDKHGFASFFFEAGYSSGSWMGLSLNLKALGLTELHEHEEDDFEDSHDHEGYLKEAYLKYKMGNTSLKLGRHKINKIPVMDGDSHRGLTLEVKEFENLDIYVSAFNRWYNNIDWKDGDGINGFQNVDEVADDAGSTVLTAMAKMKLGEGIEFLPYMAWQSDVAAVYGVRFDFKTKIDEDTEVGIDFDYYTIQEDLDSSNGDWDDTQAWKVYADVEMGGLFAGLGYFAMDEVDSGKQDHIDTDGWLDDLSGLEEHDMKGNDATIWWVDFGYSWDRYTLAFQYGDKEEDEGGNKDTDMSEWSIIGEVKATDNLSFDFRYSDVEDEPDGAGDDSYELFLAHAVYSF